MLWGSEFAPPTPGHSYLETMTQQDYDNDLVFRTNGEEYARVDGNGPWKSVTPSTELAVASSDGLKVGGNTPPSISFHMGPAPKEIARFTEEGFYYKGEFVDDAGEVHRLLKDMLNGICYKQLCIDLINNAHAGKSGQMGWTSEAEDQLLKRAAEACGPDCFTPTTWNILTQTV